MAEALLGPVFEKLLSLVENEFATMSRIKEKAEKPRNIVFRYRIGNKLKMISRRFDEIAESKNNFFLREHVGERSGGDRDRGVAEWRETSSTIDQPQIYGRDDDKEKIVEFLLNQTCASDFLSIYPIVGLGGVGKTTLAQMVYNDDGVSSTFKPKVWVCVSEDFSVKRILCSIIRSISDDKCDAWDLDKIERKVQELLQSIRYLLVLDDVWKMNQEMKSGLTQDKWNKLKSVLSCGSKGASVLVSTRDKDVAAIIELVAIGKEIVKKCGGLPLAARALGGLLCSKSEEKEWLEVKENTEIMKENLIHLWMANGFISSRRTLEIEDVGNMIWKELYQKSFFQDIKINHEGDISFKMHDLIHDLTQLVTRTEWHSLSELRDLNPGGKMSIEGLHNVGSLSEAREANLRGKKDLEKLRLSWTESKSCVTNLEQVIKELQPPSNLKSLEISNYGGLCFPSWIRNLSSLVDLKLKDCPNCVQIPSLGKLPFLRKLKISNVHHVQYMDDDECYDGVEMRAFTSLEELSLKCLPNLEGLLKVEGRETFLCLSNVTIIACPKLQWPCLPSVKSLRVKGCKNELLKSIASMSSLTTLYLEDGDKEVTFFPPEGMLRNLTCLQKLVIYSFPELKELSTELFNLIALDDLKFSVCDALESLPEQGWEGLCSLRHLKFYKCGGLRSLPDDHCWEGLRSLRHLEFYECGGLRSLADGIQHLTSLDKLKIWFCPTLKKRCKEGTGEDWDKIAHIPHKDIW
ncbi:P-loop containing nucleoside triphosphate hydrolase [Sesbania bispinosa]|nr:P-loop containing nucleoside triphosphate hydrolase [Sesbania bispinosa]